MSRKTVKNKTLSMIFALIWVPLFMYSQSTIDILPRSPRLKLDLPLFDLPYQINSMDKTKSGFIGAYASPSMYQSVALNTDIWSSYSFGMKYLNTTLKKSKVPKVLQWGIRAGVGYLGYHYLRYIPGGAVWVHEEYHRAVTSRYQIYSHNGIYDFNFKTFVVATTYKDDEELDHLKAKSPSDAVRLTAAGIEGEYLVTDQLQRNNFFYEQNFSFNLVQYWFTTINAHYYIFRSYKPSASLKNEDYILDFTRWVYDLSRPNEPMGGYWNDLSPDELGYLKLQVGLHFINYFSPMLYGFKSIPFGIHGFSGNFAMRHLVTSFGADVSAKVYLKMEPFKMAFTYHNYLNYKNYFSGIEAELVDYPIFFGKFGMYVSPRVIIGTQPKNQDFRTKKADFLGLLGVRADFVIS
jgi:hypothetical protein